MVVVDEEAGIDQKEPVFEGFVEGALLQQDSLLDGVGEVESKRSFSLSGSHVELESLMQFVPGEVDTHTV